jgi:hypothetical protein
MLMASIYDSSPDRVLKALELVDSQLWQQPSNVQPGLTYNKKAGNLSKITRVKSPAADILQQLKVYAIDYHAAKLMAQFGDASELHEPYVQLIDQWVERTASHYGLTQEVVKAKVNVMLGRIALEDKKMRRVRIGLGATCVACAVWMGFNIHQNIGVGKERQVIGQQLAQVNTSYVQVRSQALKTFPRKKSRGFLGFAKRVVGYQDPPPDQLSKVVIPQNPTPEQQELLDKLKAADEQRQQLLNELNRLGNKQGAIVGQIVLGGFLLIFIPMFGWVCIPANRYLSKQENWLDKFIVSLKSEER